VLELELELEFVELEDELLVELDDELLELFFSSYS